MSGAYPGMQSGQMPHQYGKYSLIERIAVGGMAEIYRAKTFGAAGFEKELVIKRILERFSADDEFVRMFIDEARLVARLQHANVVQIYDFDRVETAAGSSYYIAMEWVDGRDVRHLLKEGFKQKVYPSQAMAVHIAVETLKGLHYAHTRTEGGKPLDIVHRDVSPHNILLSYSGDVKISDFGIAKAAARASATSNGMVKGKLAYMSPEQVTGQPLDRRTDLFSLGIVLYEMLTHTRLFAGTSEVEVIGRVRDGTVPLPRSKNPEIAPDLEAVLLQILAADRNKRFATAADAAKALSSTSVYSANESLLVGEYVSRIFAPGARSELPAEPNPTPVEKKIVMANPSQPKPPGAPTPSTEPMSGAATMMLEVPVVAPPQVAVPVATAPPIADQKTAILDTSSSQGQEIHAQIEAARAKFASSAASAPAARAVVPAVVVAPAPMVARAPAVVVAATPIVDQKTAIFDTQSPQGQALHAQIEVARAKASGVPSASAPPPQAAPMTDQKTAILDTHSPQGQAMHAQIEAARIQAAGGGASLGSAMTDQKTAILDTNSAQGQAMQAQVAAARASAASAPSSSAGTGGAQKTMALDMSAQVQAQPSSRPRSQSRPLAPIVAHKPQVAWQRWVVGPVLMLASMGGTVLLMGALFPAKEVKKAFVDPPPPPPPAARGRIRLSTSPPGANVTLDGQPHNHFTPTVIEGPIGEVAVRVKVSMAGYKSWEQDVLFAAQEQQTNVILEQEAPGSHPAGDSKKHPSHVEHPAAEHPAPEHHGAEHHAAEHHGASGMAPVSDKGTLGVFVKPWAKVTVDGTPEDRTPKSLSLKVGKHVIELANEQLGRRERVSVTIKAGENPEVRRDWTR